MMTNIHNMEFSSYFLKSKKVLWAIQIDRLAQLVEHQTAVREVAGSKKTNTQGLKITEEKVLPL